MKRRLCSMRTLARETGLSIATISRALEGRANVSPETRLKVERAAVRLGYVRDPRIASTFAYLRRKDKPVFRETIGFLFDVQSGFMDAFEAGARERAGARGYGFETGALKEDVKEHRRLGRRLQARGIRGLIVAPITRWARAKLELEWAKFAAVEMGHTLWEPRLHRVERDTFTDLTQTLERLRDAGFRRIGLALPEGDELRRRHSPLATYLLFQRLNPEMAVLKPLNPQWPWSAEGLFGWYREQRPDVILHNGSDVGRWLAAARVAVPGDVGTVQIGFCENGESGVEPPYYEMGMAAADVVIRQLEMGELGLPERPRVIMLEGVWKEGATLVVRNG